MQQSVTPSFDKAIRIAVVGPCGSGKTTLVDGLLARGYRAKQVAQEHSYVPEMWRLLTNPDVLIYLDVSFETSTKRKQLNWTPIEFQVQLDRLRKAKEFCDIQIHTDGKTAKEVLDLVLESLYVFQSPQGDG